MYYSIRKFRVSGPSLAALSVSLFACAGGPSADGSSEAQATGAATASTGETSLAEATGGDGDGDGDGDNGCAPSLGPDNAQLDAQIENLLSANHHAGMSVCTIKGDTITWCRGYGMANIENSLAVDATTPFLLASVSKLFAATALMQRWEAGDFELDDVIDGDTDFAVLHPASGTGPTYRMLLAHAASIADSNELDGWYEYGNVDPALSLYDAVSGYLVPGGAYYVAENWSSATPGSANDYSNLGYAFVGLLAEIHAGQDFAELTSTSIFAPLGMDRTSWRVADFDLNTVAMPYEFVGGSYSPSQHYTFADYANGGLRSSACDVASFLAASAGGGGPILASETVELMQMVAYPALDDTQGLGWYSEDLGPGLWIGHSGGEQGAFTEAFYRPADGVGFVLLTNSEGDDENAIFDLELDIIAWAESL